MITSYRESIKLLGLQPGYSEPELKAAYRKAAHKHHPDKGGDPEKFKAVARAYTFLGNYIGVPAHGEMYSGKKSDSQGITINVYGGGFSVRVNF